MMLQAVKVYELFANKYDLLYNSVCSNSAEIHSLLETNKDDIEFLCLLLDRDPHTLINKHTHSISVIHVQEAIHKLKPAKSDCTDKLFFDHFIKGTDRFYTLISLLSTCLLTHGVAPSGLLLSTMIPVPKDKRASKSDSNNYRAIAILVSSILGKLFDSVVMKEHYASLITDDLQFGVKENSSTIICTQLLIETIEYYNSNMFIDKSMRLVLKLVKIWIVLCYY